MIASQDQECYEPGCTELYDVANCRICRMDGIRTRDGPSLFYSWLPTSLDHFGFFILHCSSATSLFHVVHEESKKTTTPIHKTTMIEIEPSDVPD